MVLFKPLQRQVLLLVFSVSFLGLWGCGDDYGDCHECPPEILYLTFMDTVLYDGSQTPAIVPLIGDENFYYAPNEVQLLDTEGAISFFRQECSVSCSFVLYDDEYKSIYGTEPRTFYVHFRDDVDTLVIDVTKKSANNRVHFNGKPAYALEGSFEILIVKDVY
jgi:hypothetical protein